MIVVSRVAGLRPSPGRPPQPPLAGSYPAIVPGVLASGDILDALEGTKRLREYGVLLY